MIKKDKSEHFRLITPFNTVINTVMLVGLIAYFLTQKDNKLMELDDKVNTILQTQAVHNTILDNQNRILESQGIAINEIRGYLRLSAKATLDNLTQVEIKDKDIR